MADLTSLGLPIDPHERYVCEANHVLLAGSSGQAGPTKRVRVMVEEIIFLEEDARDV